MASMYYEKVVRNGFNQQFNYVIKRTHTKSLDLV